MERIEVACSWYPAFRIFDNIPFHRYSPTNSELVRNRAHWFSVRQNERLPPIHFFVGGRKYTNFFRPTSEGLPFIVCFSVLRPVHPFWRYLRSKSKVVGNRAEFWTFLPSEILEARLAKVILKLSRLPSGTSREKSFVRLPPLTSKFYARTHWISSQIRPINVHP